MRKATLVLALALTGCGSKQPAPAAPAPEPEGPAAKVVWSVPITMEAGVPVITAKVRDGETKFAIATSSSNHTLTKSFASSVRAPVGTTRQTSKLHGQDADVEKVEGVVSIKAGGTEWRLQQVVAADAESLDGRGIGGLLVPQALVTNTTTVVLDFKGGALTLVEGDAALFESWFAGKYGAAQKLPITRDAGLLYVEAIVGNSGARRARLDSASPRSRFDAADLSAQVAGDACVPAADLMVECLPGTTANVESLALGSSSFPAWEAVAVAAEDPAIGADILGKCVFAIGVGNEAMLACN